MVKILIDNTHNEEFKFVPNIIFQENLLDIDYAFEVIYFGNQFPDYYYLKKFDLLIIGNILPASNQKDHLFLREEIKTLMNYVYNGGNLLITSGAGGDFNYKKKMNSIRALVQFTGIKRFWWGELFNTKPNCFYKENESLLFTSFQSHPIFSNISKIILTDCTFFEINQSKNLQVLLKTPKGTCFRYYKDYSEYIVDEVPIITLNKYGNGKILCIANTYFMLDDKKYGIYLADNKILFSNIVKYLIKNI